MWTKIIGFLFGSGESKGPLTVALERILPDANARAEAKETIEKLLIEYGEKSEIAQLEVNKQEAAHASVFVAGWRPAVGWVCAFALAWQYVLQPFGTWALGVILTFCPEYAIPALPILDNSQMYTVLLGMLGLGGLRTYEKIKGEVDRSSLKEQ